MAQSNPDFLLEPNRFHSAKDSTSTAAQALLQEKKSEFWNELINLRLMPSLSSSSSLKTINVVEWNLPRFRLTESFLQHAVDRESSGTLVLSHLFDPKTQTVILPTDDMQSQCRTTVIYDVVVHNACRVQNGGVLDQVGDSYYKGDMIFHIKNIPKRSVSGTSGVVVEDVRRWFVNGAVCGDDSVEVCSMKVVALKKTLFQLEKDINNVHTVPIYIENGKAVVGVPLERGREAKNVKHLQETIQLTKQQVVDEEQAFNSERANHFSACKLEITQCESPSADAASGTISFAIRVVGTETKKEYYTNLICNKTNWNSEAMYATGARNNTLSMKSNDGVVADCDTHQDERLVDVSKVAIIMLPDGFGVHEAFYAANESEAFNRSHHRLFHGHFSKGSYREGTLYTNCGVFSGSFQFNEPCHGIMKYSDKIVIIGGYALIPPQVDESAPLGSNPYRRGLHHHGNVSIRWKDGSTYDGEMRNGCITGIGAYKYPNDGSEINGELVNGMLLSNTDDLMTRLLGTFMFDGTRSWRRHP